MLEIVKLFVHYTEWREKLRNDLLVVFLWRISTGGV